LQPSCLNVNQEAFALLFDVCLQAPWLPEKLFTAGNAKVMHKAFVEAPMGIKNAGAFSEEDVDWFRASFCQPGAAHSTFNYYRAFVRWQLFGDTNGPVWR
jgi:hypothetical protein